MTQDEVRELYSEFLKTSGIWNYNVVDYCAYPKIPGSIIIELNSGARIIYLGKKA